MKLWSGETGKLLGAQSIYFIIALLVTMVTMTMTLQPLSAQIRILGLECLDENGYQDMDVVSFPYKKSDRAFLV